ncbi:hypothetical protein SAMN02745164_01877 [Marinitoga hydrogenitolerans DSM 16785]|uniref:Uncharacterized protein n=1 Tax=Marinitoga hydrogenitolerans (strain DSM 16785 / JCM 12826 / AT1271) TaxID=1122195 RepID=A0A1M4Z956_MARH1|nr:hypothetical protein [Marinitoga hydrogenitolerans]SHF14560.1 hypothetical protein SAMN02745164_01877 [Marinitoga hydrogenitolerans DSM 16785]
MSEMSIKIDEEFLNGLIDKLIEENTSIKGLKNLNIEMRNDGIHFQVEVNILGKDTLFDSLIELKEKPKSLTNGILKFVLSGDDGIRKILEGVFSIISRFIEGIDSNDYEIDIDFSKINFSENIKPLLNALRLEKFEIKNKEFILNIKYEE